MGGDSSSDVTECSKPFWKKIARHAGHDVAEAAPVIEATVRKPQLRFARQEREETESSAK